MNPKVRLRDFVITKDDWIFAVADYNHKDGIRAMLRYIPDNNGDRELKGRRYKKLDFEDAFKFLNSKKPEYVKDVHVIPNADVAKVLRPNEVLPEIIKTDKKVAKIVKVLLSSGIPMSKMGITGSRLLGLAKKSSDIDFVVYGQYWFNARLAIEKAKKEKIIDRLSDEMWKFIYKKRVPEISFEKFLWHELRKGNRGMVDGIYFDLLFTRDWSQINEDYLKKLQRGRDIGTAKITAKVTGADFSFDSPAIYEVDHEGIDQVLSYTHTYAGQAKVGETIQAKGVVEVTPNLTRLVVGTTREAKGEWIIISQQGKVKSEK
ncbi:MAG: nucleotidyltransferase domain-containing protein [Methanosarcinales archaeon]